MNSDPAREVFECGVQLARGFPPRSKWTYGEVFHPAVVLQPPFNFAVALEIFFTLCVDSFSAHYYLTSYKVFVLHTVYN